MFVVTRPGLYLFTRSAGSSCRGDFWGFEFSPSDPSQFGFYGADSDGSASAGSRYVSFTAGYWYVQVIADHSHYGNDSDPACFWTFNVSAP